MLPPELAALLKKRGYALNQAEQILGRLPSAAPESLLHALRDLLDELYLVDDVPQNKETPEYQDFLAAYNDILGELEQHSLFDDPDLWAELYPVLLRRLKFAFTCLQGHSVMSLDSDSYPEVFRAYCQNGAKGAIGYDEALSVFADMMHTTVDALPEDDETVVALKQLKHLRDSAQELFAHCPTTHEQYQKAKDCFNRMMEVLAFEALLAFPRYKASDDEPLL